MAKKFFYNRVYNTKRMITNIVIIGVCIIGVIICFIFTSNFQGENKNPSTGELSIKNDATIEVNENFSAEIFFSKIENVDMKNIKIIYPDNYDVSKAGKYDIILEIDGEKYNTTLTIIDTIKPELTLKQLYIDENNGYFASDFVASCSDNSGKECLIDFFKEGTDEDGNNVDYSNYRSAGTYAIKIIATDDAGNETIKETQLIINKNGGTEQPQPPTLNTTCKYGNDEYDANSYLIAIYITTNNCAISLDLYKDSNITANINKTMESETTRIKKDINALNLPGTLALNRKITAVINSSGSGIVGYELEMTITITNNGNSETIAEYKIDKDGKRIFTQNKYNLSN